MPRIASLSLLRVSRAAVILVAIATAVAMAILWPGGVAKRFAEVVQPNDAATVLRVTDNPCAETVATRCTRVTIRVTSGDDKGKLGLIQDTNDGIDPTLHKGDKIRVAETPEVPGYDYGDTLTAYTVTDFSRGTQMLVLFGIFALFVLLFSRLRGVFSLLGLGVSLAIVLFFVVPGILNGKPPVLVAIVGSLAIALTTIVLCHGRGPRALAAMLGTIATLGLTAGMAALFTSVTRLTGLASDESFALRLVDQHVSLTGLLIAGMVIGALGVLDDVTVSQSSTVFALRAANPALGYRELVGHAMEVGRDHVAATVNTLVLAYAGSSLPVLLIFASGALSLGQAASLELVAEQIVGTLVGSIGLIAAVPLTTAFAALLARSLPREELHAEAAGGHVH